MDISCLTGNAHQAQQSTIWLKVLLNPL